MGILDPNLSFNIDFTVDIDTSNRVNIGALFKIDGLFETIARTKEQISHWNIDTLVSFDNIRDKIYANFIPKFPSLTLFKPQPPDHTKCLINIFVLTPYRCLTPAMSIILYYDESCYDVISAMSSLYFKKYWNIETRM